MLDGEFLFKLISSAGVIITVIGGFIVRDRQIREKMADGDEKLHQRINDFRNEYVRRDELGTHIKSLERSVDRVEQSVHGISQRLDNITVALVKNGNTNGK